MVNPSYYLYRENRPCTQRYELEMAGKLHTQLTSLMELGTWNPRNDVILQPSDPLLSDETGSACTSQKSDILSP